MSGQSTLFADPQASGAVFSACRTWRYTLRRTWDPNRNRTLNVIGLNPSVASEEIDDPTSRRCIGFAKAWGYGQLVMTNLFAYRSTDPAGLLSAADPIGPDNDVHLYEQARRASGVLVAWGAHPSAVERAIDVLELLNAPGIALTCLGTTNGGAPRHPLYVRADVRPAPFGGAS